MATDNKVTISADVVKRASAKIKELTDQLNKATAVSKYASLKLSNRKRAEAVDAVVQELTADVSAKLTDAGVEPEVIEQATDVVEMAVAEALSSDLPEDSSEAMDASAEAEAIIDEETEEELAELAASEDEDEMVKEAALKLLNRKMNKKAFGQEIVKLVKKAATTVYTGGRMGTRKSASHSAGGLSPAERALVDSMYK